jgi:hypothetical protein
MGGRNQKPFKITAIWCDAAPATLPFFQGLILTVSSSAFLTCVAS